MKFDFRTIGIDPDARLRRILRALIRRSFPGLRRQRVTISWGSECELLYYAVEAGRPCIRVNNCLRMAPRAVLEGGIAHELCHIDADLKLGPCQRELAWKRYAGSPWAHMREERAVEGRVIELGYGAQLLALIRYVSRFGYSFSRRDGLVYAEIRRALNTMKA